MAQFRFDVKQPCPHCGARELLLWNWDDYVWDNDQKAALECDVCGAVVTIDEYLPCAFDRSMDDEGDA